MRGEVSARSFFIINRITIGCGLGFFCVCMCASENEKKRKKLTAGLNRPPLMR